MPAGIHRLAQVTESCEGFFFGASMVPIWCQTGWHKVVCSGIRQQKTPCVKGVLRGKVVHPQGLEPWTYGLKVRCSTN